MPIIHRGFDLSEFQPSGKTLELIRKHDDLEERHRKYRMENADCARQYIDDSHGPTSRDYYVPALRKADRELREQEMQAVADGRSLPDRDKYLAEVRFRVKEYERVEPALARAVEQAESAATDAIVKELPELARQGFEQSERALKRYRAAIAKAARAQLAGSVSRFLWAATAGELTRPKWRGFSGALGEEVNARRTTSDGRLTFDSAKDLGLIDQYRGNRAEFGDFVAPPEEDAA
ncbi:MAG: hypothetical protein JF597_14155 [Streptomyces sp.]|jgi:hypothetical protein|uniref:hypothetical protein n=1 Tax=Streptomyces sp. TaxID=1931 RepID=UPI0025E48B29|nr:hypothetical protein [Streptomyces sp.]MBW8794697.1 hypothetical protein [Streptomyces sp.]